MRTGTPDASYGTSGRALYQYPGNQTDNGRLRNMEILPNNELLQLDVLFVRDSQSST